MADRHEVGDPVASSELGDELGDADRRCGVDGAPAVWGEGAWPRPRHGAGGG